MPFVFLRGSGSCRHFVAELPFADCFSHLRSFIGSVGGLTDPSRCRMQAPIGTKSVVFSRCSASVDSDLDAFSRNPTDGSFAVLAFQLAAFTKYANRVFLSY